MTLPTIYDVNGVLSSVPISRNKLYDELESGRLVGEKIGNKWLIPEPNVLAWLGLNVEDDASGMSGVVIPLDSLKSTASVSHA